MRVAVTGGSGKAGRATVTALGEAGLDVVSVDVAATADPDAPTLIVDLTDPGQTFEALSGFDAVAHLAAIPAPGIRTDAETFRNNMMSTYNVFSAATKLGHDRIVWASSETLIGLPFDRERPAYAPIDEEHPLLPESHYSLSKLAGEAIAEQFNRWSGIPIVSLRISNIMEPDDYARFPSFWEDPRLRAWNLWGYVDARDVAQMVLKSLRSDISGNEAFLVAAADTCMTQPSLDLMAEVYPDVPIREGLSGHRTLLSIDKAAGMLGYEPEVSWRDHVSDGTI